MQPQQPGGRGFYPPQHGAYNQQWQQQWQIPNSSGSPDNQAKNSSDKKTGTAVSGQGAPSRPVLQGPTWNAQPGMPPYGYPYGYSPRAMPGRGYAYPPPGAPMRMPLAHHQMPPPGHYYPPSRQHPPQATQPGPRPSDKSQPTHAQPPHYGYHPHVPPPDYLARQGQPYGHPGQPSGHPGQPAGHSGQPKDPGQPVDQSGQPVDQSGQPASQAPEQPKAATPFDNLGVAGQHLPPTGAAVQGDSTPSASATDKPAGDPFSDIFPIQKDEQLKKLDSNMSFKDANRKPDPPDPTATHNQSSDQQSQSSHQPTDAHAPRQQETHQPPGPAQSHQPPGPAQSHHQVPIHPFGGHSHHQAHNPQTQNIPGMHFYHQSMPRQQPVAQHPNFGIPQFPPQQDAQHSAPPQLIQTHPAQIHPTPIQTQPTQVQPTQAQPTHVQPIKQTQPELDFFGFPMNSGARQPSGSDTLNQDNTLSTGGVDDEFGDFESASQTGTGTAVGGGNGDDDFGDFESAEFGSNEHQDQPNAETKNKASTQENDFDFGDFSAAPLSSSINDKQSDEEFGDFEEASDQASDDFGDFSSAFPDDKEKDKDNGQKNAASNGDNVDDWMDFEVSEQTITNQFNDPSGLLAPPVDLDALIHKTFDEAVVDITHNRPSMSSMKTQEKSPATSLFDPPPMAHFPPQIKSEKGAHFSSTLLDSLVEEFNLGASDAPLVPLGETQSHEPEESDDDFGDFESATFESHETAADSASKVGHPAGDDNSNEDDFGDFGDFESATFETSPNDANADDSDNFLQGASFPSEKQAGLLDPPPEHEVEKDDGMFGAAFEQHDATRKQKGQEHEQSSEDEEVDIVHQEIQKEIEKEEGEEEESGSADDFDADWAKFSPKKTQKKKVKPKESTKSDPNEEDDQLGFDIDPPEESNVGNEEDNASEEEFGFDDELLEGVVEKSDNTDSTKPKTDKKQDAFADLMTPKSSTKKHVQKSVRVHSDNAQDNQRDDGDNDDATRGSESDGSFGSFTGAFGDENDGTNSSGDKQSVNKDEERFAKPAQIITKHAISPPSTHSAASTNEEASSSDFEAPKYDDPFADVMLGGLSSPSVGSTGTAGRMDVDDSVDIASYLDNCATVLKYIKTQIKNAIKITEKLDQFNATTCSELNNTKLSSFYHATSEMYRVARRIEATNLHKSLNSGLEGTEVTSLLNDVQKTWTKLTSIASKQSGQMCKSVLSFSETNKGYSQSVMKGENCGLCLITFGNSQETLEHDGNTYHSSCINLWANGISKLSPKQVLS